VNRIVYDVFDIESTGSRLAKNPKQKTKNWQGEVKGILKAELNAGN